MTSQRVPVLRISLTNATVLSAIYLVSASVIELVRRQWNPHWADRASLAMEAFPARALELLGLFAPMRRAVVHEQLSPFHVRLILGATAVGLIFAIGLAVGGLMALVARRATREE